MIVYPIIVITEVHVWIWWMIIDVTVPLLILVRNLCSINIPTMGHSHNATFPQCNVPTKQFWTGISRNGLLYVIIDSLPMTYAWEIEMRYGIFFHKL